MPSWFKKQFGKKEEQTPSGPTSISSRHNGLVPSSQTSSTSSRPRVSSHDLTMAATTLGSAMAPPSHRSNGNLNSSPSQQRLQEQHDADLALAYSLAQQDNPQFSSMQQTNTTPVHSTAPQGQNRPSPSSSFPSPQPSLPALPSPTSFQQQQSLQQQPGPQLRPFSSLPVPSQYQRQQQPPITFTRPPPRAFKNADLALAAALADSEFAARQADELARTSEAVYQAAVNRAMEASLQTANNDSILRELKLWAIDLAAAIDDVHTALDGIVKKQKESFAKLDKALEHGDERKAAKYSWAAEQLPIAEAKLRSLADRLTPVGLAITELQDLREEVVATSPPIAEAERRRDDIIARLFRLMEDAGLSAGSMHGGGGGAGPSTAQQGPGDIRDFIALLVEEAQRLPKMPRRRSNASISMESPARTSDDNEDAGSSSSSRHTGPSAPPFMETNVVVIGDDNKGKSLIDSDQYEESIEASTRNALKSFSLQEDALFVGKDDDSRDSCSQQDEKNASMVDGVGDLSVNSIANGRSMDGGVMAMPGTPSLSVVSIATGSPTRKTTMTPALAASVQSQKGSVFTTPEPFNLSTSKPREIHSSNTSPVPIDTIRRVPAIVSLHYELDKDSGIVSQTVAWPRNRESSNLRKKNIATSSPPLPASHSSPGASMVKAINIEELPPLSPLENSSPSSSESLLVDAVSLLQKSHSELLPSSIVLHPLVVVSGVGISSIDPDKLICAAAITVHALETAVEELSSWNTATTTSTQPPSAASPTHSSEKSNNTRGNGTTPSSNTTTNNASALAVCIKLYEVITAVASHVALVAYPHEPLRQALSKQGIAWDDELVRRVRWAAQHAAGVVMHCALTCSENAQRIRGPFQRQAVVQPLGYAVMSTFAVHQLAGGFGGDAALLCDSLLERTVHYARLIDPKWFRGTRVVT